jgi:hypothetical protein
MTGFYLCIYLHTLDEHAGKLATATISAVHARRNG